MSTIKRPLLLALLLTASFLTAACDPGSLMNGVGPDDICSEKDGCHPTVPPHPVPIRE